MAKILITGGTGLVGRNLTKRLKSSGFEVVWLSRRAMKVSFAQCYQWDVAKGFIDDRALDGVDCIVHLAGANVGAKRWTKSYKKQLWDSRTKSIELLIDAVKRNGTKLKTFIGASAIGYYGDSGDEICTETSKKGKDFLADLCEAWEKGSEPFSDMAIKRIMFRIGLVLSKEGGALEKMELPAKMGLGAYFGNGKQYYSWVHIDDLCSMIMSAIEEKVDGGIYNAVAPNPVTNKAFAKALNKAMGRPFIPAPAPKFVARLLMGEMADIVLNSNRVSAEKVLKTGFKFQYENLNHALQSLYS